MALTVSLSCVDVESGVASAFLSLGQAVGDGTLLDETGTTLDGDPWFDKSQEVYVVVTPNDGTDDGRGARAAAASLSRIFPFNFGGKWRKLFDR
mgnify:CR=1 FL=1